MTTIITTESGTRYALDGRWVTRIPTDDTHAMRRDGERLKFWGEKPVIGRRMILFLEPLNGADPAIATTMRTTTPVISIEENAVEATLAQG